MMMMRMAAAASRATAAGQTAVRSAAMVGSFARMSTMPQMTLAMAESFAEEHQRFLSNPNMVYSQQLNAIKTQMASQPTNEKWQAAVQVYLGCQVNCMINYGFRPDEQGLQNFTEQFQRLRQSQGAGSSLSAAVRETWHTLLQEAFDVDTAQLPSFTVEQARDITRAIGQKLQSDACHQAIDRAVADLSSSATDQDRQRALLGVITPIQMEVASSFGLEGEQGYVKMQALLMVHSDDSTVQYNTMAATMPLFTRAGINVGGAPTA
ncbi:uncharacterized protein MONBRDRAFT_36787 [Monosiga brevicollis MX1]|uniref:Uncharacterized protein n=1 Tax=Monosiga brevicollis TaxID=81824 RepID=A9UXR6_MONBE|nr:uncharacterized protein MONBRDRAFT_36787 [Monosiga brevicollis MX1]EDQ89734.1 predicted protein [Monosiga brevicollis MX1]|eukprot:XP_001745156.1 hypothetical protein [Monosiga brevicollis MX1]